jgi:hypothetical protein
MSHSPSKHKQIDTETSLAPAKDIALQFKATQPKLNTNWVGQQVTMQDIIAIMTNA